MKIKKYLFLGLSLFFLTFLISYAQPIPTLPTIIQGKITINENPAPIGTEISGFIDDLNVGNANTTKEGLYIIAVSGSMDDEGKQISLFVDGIDAKINTTWSSGNVETINLAITKNNTRYYIYAALSAFVCFVVFMASRHLRKSKK